MKEKESRRIAHHHNHNRLNLKFILRFMLVFTSHKQIKHIWATNPLAPSDFNLSNSKV